MCFVCGRTKDDEICLKFLPITAKNAKNVPHVLILVLLAFNSVLK